jgi:NadR type nicotinamide-nucleotide adenylyltransferase
MVEGSTRPVLRIVLTGPECTGKSTLAARLGAELGARLMPESARTYAHEVARELTVSDVERIAKRHVAAEDTAVRGGAKTLVFDTDLISTIVYGRHYYDFRSAWIEEEAHSRLADLYLLCTPDIPWVADGIRDRPGDRREMLTEFRDTLAYFGARVVEISGTGESRYTAVKAAADSVAT